MSVQPPVYMTVAEYLAWDPGDDVRYELVDGEPRAMGPANVDHAFFRSELCRLLGNHLLERGSLWVALANPGVIPRLLSSHNVRVPAVGVTCTPQRRGAATMTHLILLIGILSPSNQGKTWSNMNVTKHHRAAPSDHKSSGC
jgi:Uma2 family endonuclease